MPLKGIMKDGQKQKRRISWGENKYTTFHKDEIEEVPP